MPHSLRALWVVATVASVFGRADMVKVIRKQRRPPILTPSAIPCLRDLPTVNVTQGCALGCTYCYIRSYPDYPGADRVVLFENTADVVREELKRKRRMPARVYFSPSSDAFQYVPEVQDVSFQTMAILLEAGVELSFLTKGLVSGRFLDLFGEHADRVHAQIGVTSLCQALWRTLEPRTAPPALRVETIHTLACLGCHVTARLDPLIPDVTDTARSLNPLLKCLGEAGIRFAAASYLFLRPAIATGVLEQLEGLGVPTLRPHEWGYQRFSDGCGGGRCISIAERRERFERIAAIGAGHGITISPCWCKNPTMATGTCQIAGSARPPLHH